ncbi:hypothetical protein GPL15_14835 [Clostridium sp. MCC353]|uniref:prenylated flavin chaperone LpdD n=1 Tax=Clostridium sp. MCC353 TaxID=2592646 RepID=UPI001C0344E8|nr:hypothetical protein [Clostridium sp. MCC353]MBT9777778.1 hypothetical protein [Clostridium sp. MCC353]
MNMHYTAEQEGIKTEASLIKAGNDLLVVLTGGDMPHIGAAVCCDGKGNVKEAALPGHKDQIVMKIMAERLGKVAGCSVCVTGGIHIDGITGGQIRLVMELCERLTDEMICSLNETGVLP